LCLIILFLCLKFVYNFRREYHNNETKWWIIRKTALISPKVFSTNDHFTLSIHFFFVGTLPARSYTPLTEGTYSKTSFTTHHPTIQEKIKEAVHYRCRAMLCIPGFSRVLLVLQFASNAFALSLHSINFSIHSMFFMIFGGWSFICSGAISGETSVLKN